MAGSELIFISGGVRSGKSAYAEKLIREHGSSERLYLASGQKGDAEMDERIHKHRRDRQFDGWTTIEAQVKFERVVEDIPEGAAVLWDCVTTWLANELYAGWEHGTPCVETEGCMERKWQELQMTIARIRVRASLFVIVSNEVLDEPIKDPSYQRWLGRIHIWLASEAVQAIEMESGLAFHRK
ncbi:bifunctional adenosylcobinamide kinase/adenosylcobinamide-phosphate guanylyltransferase [Planomicrobium sp. YIM 101495]|uniref:bifunctional adenosylcobinamide kinase/adenosylcobinamide-phosphate guanylyltransferase n=1 Tax=Planomicrobium sp. YIM 101495 TaxID=2665160 RepID=UPI0012B89CF0|nr:bifunctional adenosylcobinamide kinase/adenosylcobinamide-phosphate guanylyltransferase [Planomicrobium sp. YIM 101495]MTD30877.1 cobinamide kinase [Planomicrobium sp. YIM 101495]